MSKAEFLRVQYLPDLFRDEPLNVGVIVRKEGELAAKFVGEMEPGELDGRKLRSFGNPSVYSQWVGYWRKVLASEDEDALQELVETSGAHFRVVPGGEVTDVGEDPVGSVADYLYSVLVSPGGFAEAIRAAAEEEGAEESGQLEEEISDELVGRNILEGAAEVAVPHPVLRRPVIRGEKASDHRPAYVQRLNGRLDVMEAIDLTGYFRSRIKHHAGWMAYMFEDIRRRREGTQTIAILRWSDEAAEDEERRYARSLAEVEATHVVDWTDRLARMAFLEERQRVAEGL